MQSFFIFPLFFLLWCHLLTTSLSPVIFIMLQETLHLIESQENNNFPSQRKQRVELHGEHVQLSVEEVVTLTSHFLSPWLLEKKMHLTSWASVCLPFILLLSSCICLSLSPTPPFLFTSPLQQSVLSLLIWSIYVFASLPYITPPLLFRAFPYLHISPLLSAAESTGICYSRDIVQLLRQHMEESKGNV